MKSRAPNVHGAHFFGLTHRLTSERSFSELDFTTSPLLVVESPIPGESRSLTGVNIVRRKRTMPCEYWQISKYEFSRRRVEIWAPVNHRAA